MKIDSSTRINTFSPLKEVSLHLWMHRNPKRPLVIVFSGISEHDPGLFISSYKKKLSILNCNILFVIYNAEKWSPKNRFRKWIGLPYSDYECSGLVAAGKEVAKFLSINTFFSSDYYVLAHSKGCISALSFLEDYPDIQRLVFSSFPVNGALPANKQKSLEQLNALEKLFYLLTFRGHKVDEEISNPHVLERLEINIPVGHIHKIISVVAYIRTRHITLNFSTLVCYYLNYFKILNFNDDESSNDYKGFNDGVVTLNSQMSLIGKFFILYDGTHNQSFGKAISVLQGRIKS